MAKGFPVKKNAKKKLAKKVAPAKKMTAQQALELANATITRLRDEVLNNRPFKDPSPVKELERLPAKLEKQLITQLRALNKPVPIVASVFDGLATATELWFTDTHAGGDSESFSDDFKVAFDPNATDREKKLFKELRTHTGEDIFYDALVDAAQKDPTLRANKKAFAKFEKNLEKLTKKYDFEPYDILSQV